MPRTPRLRYFAPFAALLVSALAATPAQALFHLWDFTEVFASPDGAVQFIELRTLSNGETVATAGQLRSQSTGKTFNFPSNLTGLTANRFLLVATAGFGGLPGGVTPDFTLPADFFNPAGDTVSLLVSGFGTVDSRAFPALPTDGIMSRHYPANTLATNSPTNYNGASGSVNLAPPPETTGDYNGNGIVDAADYTVWRDTFGQDVDEGTGADGIPDGTIDDEDYDFWKSRFGDVVEEPGSGSAASVLVPEPAVWMLSISGIAALAVAVCRRRQCDRSS